MTVIDASSLAKYILKERNWETVRTYLTDSPYSISLALAEVSNAIYKASVIYKKISIKNAKIMFKAIKILQENVLLLEPFERYLDRAMEIAVSENITIYDALYIAQAEKYGEFLTSDKKQGEIARKIGINVTYID